MNKEILEKLRQAISTSSLKQSAVEDFMSILQSAELSQQKILLDIFKEDPTLATISYMNIKKKQQALASDDSPDAREILASEFNLLTSLQDR